MCGGKEGVEDAVTAISASFTGGSTAHIFIHRTDGVGGVDGVDVFLVCSVFSFFAVAGAIPVDNCYGNLASKGVGQVRD